MSVREWSRRAARLCVALALWPQAAVAQAPAVEVVHRFVRTSGGVVPLGSLLKGEDGSLYGTTSLAGASA